MGQSKPGSISGAKTMFPNGRWRGWWEQETHGRQWMDPLELRANGSTLSGNGHDLVGPFTLTGSRESDGTMRLLKQYQGQHAVLYIGRTEGEGTIVGRWSIANLCWGRFALIPLGELTRDMPIAEISLPAPNP